MTKQRSRRRRRLKRQRKKERRKVRTTEKTAWLHATDSTTRIHFPVPRAKSIFMAQFTTLLKLKEGRPLGTLTILGDHFPCLLRGPSGGSTCGMIEICRVDERYCEVHIEPHSPPRVVMGKRTVERLIRFLLAHSAPAT